MMVSVALTLTLGYALLAAYGACRAWQPDTDHPPSDAAPDAGIERLKSDGTALERALAVGAFRKGGRVEDLVREHPPDLLFRHPPYVTLMYRGPVPHAPFFAGAQVVAKDGRLLQAKASIPTGSGHFRAVYFWSDGWEASQEYMDTWAQAVDRWQEGFAVASMAVVGPAGTAGLIDIPTAPPAGEK